MAGRAARATPRAPGAALYTIRWGTPPQDVQQAYRCCVLRTVNARSRSRRDGEGWSSPDRWRRWMPFPWSASSAVCPDRIDETRRLREGVSKPSHRVRGTRRIQPPRRAGGPDPCRRPKRAEGGAGDDRASLSRFDPAPDAGGRQGDRPPRCHHRAQADGREPSCRAEITPFRDRRTSHSTPGLHLLPAQPRKDRGAPRMSQSHRRRGPDRSPRPRASGARADAALRAPHGPRAGDRVDPRHGRAAGVWRTVEPFAGRAGAPGGPHRTDRRHGAPDRPLGWRRRGLAWPVCPWGRRSAARASAARRELRPGVGAAAPRGLWRRLPGAAPRPPSLFRSAVFGDRR